jgi:sugar lactone lactonase YvrE
VKLRPSDGAFLSAVSAAQKNAQLAISLAVALAATFGPTVVVRGQLASSTWPDYGGGLANTHQANAVGPANPTVAWTYNLANAQGRLSTYAFRQPALGNDGSIYFLTYPGLADQNVIALNPNGTLRWSILGPTNISQPGNWPAVTAQGNLLYMSGATSTTTSRLLERDGGNGSLIWVGPDIQSTYQTGPTVSTEGIIYTTDDRGTLQSLTPAGQANWTVQAAGPYVNPAIGPSGIIYSGGASLSAVASDGSIQWSIAAQPQPGTMNARIFTSPAVDHSGNVYVGTSTISTDPGYLLAVDSSGHQLWTRDGVGGAPAVGPDGTIYAGYQGVLHAMSPTNGHDLWTYQTGSIDEFGAEGVTIDRDGNIYASTTRGNVLSINKTGQLRWDINLAPGAPHDVFLSAPALAADGTLYVGGGYAGKFFAIRNAPEPATVVSALTAAIALLGLSICKRYQSRRIGAFSGNNAK